MFTLCGRHEFAFLWSIGETKKIHNSVEFHFSSVFIHTDGRRNIAVKAFIIKENFN